MANRLIDETSPYLLQHAHNPVEWYAWGEDALAAARAQDKPIFLSVGYSACHWCHVMERECFENESIAALMNSLFINIKVDREERPDIDEIYMKAVTALTGQGGWPMSVFLTPELEPFFGATYLPPVRAYGRPSFPDVLIGLAEAYKSQRADVAAQAQQLTAAIVAEAKLDARGELDPEVLKTSAARFHQSFDAAWGGFGPAPKFPHAGDLRLCLRLYQRSGDEKLREMALYTLDRMARGGMFDQLAGGFHRYSTDREWRVPHFEKMLYDNALLISAYLEAFLFTRDERHAAVARACCDWALSEMQTESGGFASAQDADSEGEEGRFFVWTPRELEQVLGAELAQPVAAFFGISEGGNFEHGKNVLWIPETAAEVATRLGLPELQLVAAVERARPLLMAARSQRVRPQTDDKLLASWNGLMAGALAQAYQILEEPRYLGAAERCLDFVLASMRQPDGRLFASYRLGRARHNAGLDDYAFTIAAALDLYEASFEPRWLREALALAELVEQQFADTDSGGYFTTGLDHERLIARLPSVHDGALPSGLGVHALNLLRLAAISGRQQLAERAEAALKSQASLCERYPQAFAQLLLAFDFLSAPARQVVIAGAPDNPRAAELLRRVRSSARLQRVVVRATSDTDIALIPLAADKPAGPNGARAYVCVDFQCKAPVDEPEQLVV
ncbi:MAG TPA: thioredoxin domain-containing protein [Polyangiales bacterium]|nr:thioredoxin domain-containing protein [Polyangiales bacterium]